MEINFHSFLINKGDSCYEKNNKLNFFLMCIILVILIVVGNNNISNNGISNNNHINNFKLNNIISIINSNIISATGSTVQLVSGVDLIPNSTSSSDMKKNTQNLQKAIDNLSESGGGTIYLLARNFYLAQSGTVSNKTAYSNVYNHIH